MYLDYLLIRSHKTPQAVQRADASPISPMSLQPIAPQQYYCHGFHTPGPCLKYQAIHPFPTPSRLMYACGDPEPFPEGMGARQGITQDVNLS